MLYGIELRIYQTVLTLVQLEKLILTVILTYLRYLSLSPIT